MRLGNTPTEASEEKCVKITNHQLQDRMHAYYETEQSNI